MPRSLSSRCSLLANLLPPDPNGTGHRDNGGRPGPLSRLIAYLLLVRSLAGLYHTAVAYKRFVDNVLIEIGRTFLWGVTVGPDAALFSGLAGHGLSPSLKGHEKCMTLLASSQSATVGCK
jgi:hypothetical protein